AESLFGNACARWADSAFGGGLWYNDDRKVKSVYQANLILAGVRLSEVTGDPGYRERALPLYEWVERHLLRPDGLTWCDYGENGPRISGNHREAASDTFLGGNMAMGVIAARLYRDTGRKVYKDRALRAAKAVTTLETDGKGALMDDRDAWTDGYFMGYWAREVLTLPGIRPEARKILQRTAQAIWQRARKPDGFYSGCWNGPVEGEACPWTKAGFRPQQIMTSASAVHVLVAAISPEAGAPKSQ
ncbi:MAG TPA: glycoside hydrolase family 76 protein, partial [Chthonomonadaceae bacterium]|nr:glycoside hydrolase family 76 protein [Chthonomonadaceae bacterium]